MILTDQSVRRSFFQIGSPLATHVSKREKVPLQLRGEGHVITCTLRRTQIENDIDLIGLRCDIDLIGLRCPQVIHLR